MTSVTTDTTPPNYSICKGLEQLPHLVRAHGQKISNIYYNSTQTLCWYCGELGFICNQNGKIQWKSLRNMPNNAWSANHKSIARQLKKALKPINKPSQEQLILANSLEKKNLMDENDKLKKLNSRKGTKLKEYKKRQEELIKELDEKEELAKSDKNDLKNMASVITNLVRTFTNEQQRKELEEKMKADKKGLDEYFCEGCGLFAVYQEGSTKKCIHTDCPGMCTGCFNIKNPEGFEVCSCCNKKQELECPICYTKRQSDMMTKGSNCCHHICCVCYTNAERGGNKIKDCPMCRAKF
jgi:hypothetical protein